MGQNYGGELINMPLLLRLLYRIETQRCNKTQLAEDAEVHPTTVMRQLSYARRWLNMDIRYSARHRMYTIRGWGVLKRGLVMDKAKEIYA